MSTFTEMTIAQLKKEQKRYGITDLMIKGTGTNKAIIRKDRIRVVSAAQKGAIAKSSTPGKKAFQKKKASPKKVSPKKKAKKGSPKKSMVVTQQMMEKESKQLDDAIRKETK